MRHYPAFLNPAHLRALVVGAGGVGLRKIGTLLSCEIPDVLILDKAKASPELEELLACRALHFEKREFEPRDLDGRNLVFACTRNKRTNAKIGRLARERGVLVNIADAPADSTFIVPSSVARDPLTVAFSTGGASPAMARRIRREMQEYFGPHYGLFLTLMERMRPLVLDLGMDTSANTELFRALAASGLLEALRAGDGEAVRALLADLLPGALTPRIGELLDGIC